VLELLRRLCRERQLAAVIVSHDPMAAAYADRTLTLRDGKLRDHEEDRVAEPHTADAQRASPLTLPLSG